MEPQLSYTRCSNHATYNATQCVVHTWFIWIAKANASEQTDDSTSHVWCILPFTYSWMCGVFVSTPWHHMNMAKIPRNLGPRWFFSSLAFYRKLRLVNIEWGVVHNLVELKQESFVLNQWQFYHFRQRWYAPWIEPYTLNSMNSMEIIGRFESFIMECKSS